MSPPFGFFFRLAAGGQDAVIHFPSFFFFFCWPGDGKYTGILLCSDDRQPLLTRGHLFHLRFFFLFFSFLDSRPFFFCFTRPSWPSAVSFRLFHNRNRTIFSSISPQFFQTQRQIDHVSLCSSLRCERLTHLFLRR